MYKHNNKGEKKILIFLCLSRNRKEDGSQKCNVNCSGDLIQRGIFLFYCVMHIPLFIITRNFYFGLSGPHLLVEQHNKKKYLNQISKMYLHK